MTAPSVFPNRPGANEHVTDETPAGSLIERIGVLVERTDASLALWGSLGTATELMVAWNLAYVAPFAGADRKPVAAVGEPWLSLVPHLETVLDTEPGLVFVTADLVEAIDHLAASL